MITGDRRKQTNKKTLEIIYSSNSNQKVRDFVSVAISDYYISTENYEALMDEQTGMSLHTFLFNFG